MNLSRRSVLKALAASLAAPVIQLRPEIPDEKLLLAFCSESEWRPIWKPLEKPFGIDSLTYATDRFAMIRCELPNRLEIDEIELPSVRDVWKKYWEPTGQWQLLTPDDVTPIKHDSWEPCPGCANRRVSLGENYPDFNDPVVSSSMDRYDYDVDDNTIRDRSCPVCHGLKSSAKNVCVISGVEHSLWRLKKIAALPNVSVCRTAFDEHTILFRADGFEGISKGMVPDRA